MRSFFGYGRGSECRHEEMRMHGGGRGRGGGFGRGRFGHGRFGHGRGSGEDGPGGRMLGHGDLRYVILSLLEEKPSHGYELIKMLEEKSAGHYSPSPGVIYPTLTFLEESSYATSTTEENKKRFAITDEGKKFLDEHRDMVAALFERMQSMGQKMQKMREWFGQERPETSATLRGAMHRLKSQLFTLVPMSKAQEKQVMEIIERAVQEIAAIKTSK